MNIRLDIEYIGTNFCGWQRQRGSPTVQGELEKCLKDIYKRHVTLLGSGRTDSGVHAHNQVANFHIDGNRKINMIGLRNDLNSLLNEEIRVKKCSKVSEGFHSQHSSKKKIYLYRIKTVNPCTVFEEGRFWFIKKELNIEAIRECSKKFVGEKDFKNFCKTGYAGESTTRIVKKVSIKRNANYIDLFIAGNGFLRGMVRLIVGCLINYERGKIKQEDIDLAIKNEKRLKLNLSAPAEGLYLYDVEY
jgi:tRNA pseudouridine38-40 synthase